MLSLPICVLCSVVLYSDLVWCAVVLLGFFVLRGLLSFVAFVVCVCCALVVCVLCLFGLCCFVVWLVLCNFV